jgi:transcriptional regulator with XRE-family HTH domain
MKYNNFNNTSKEIGTRFLFFRKAVRKTRSDFALELKVAPAQIAAIENGSTKPPINYLHHFFLNYGLNLNWLLSGNGDMFYDDSPRDLDSRYATSPEIKEGDPDYEKYLEFKRLMQVPSVEKAIMESFKEMIEELKKEP